MPALVSIVIPSYNNAAFIEATMASVLEQTYTDLEVIVSDHSSTDGTWEKLQQFAGDARVRLFQTPTGGGAPANWKAVTREATGEYLKLVCGDDVIYPEMVTRQVDVLQRSGAVLSATKRDIINASGKVLVKARGLQGVTSSMPGVDAVRAAVRAGTNVFGEPGCVLMRREALEAEGGWDARDPYVIDQQTYSRVLTHGEFAPVNESLAAFRLSSGQWTAKLANSQSAQVVSYHHRFAAEHPGTLTRTDLALGDTRARAMAYVRRAANFYLSKTHAAH